MKESNKGYQFSTTWFPQSAAHWPQLFKSLGWDPSRSAAIIEIGSYEGRSACWILDNLVGHPESRLHCIDTFKGSIEHAPGVVEGLSERFEKNIERTGKRGQVNVCAGRSDEMLARLIAQGVRADFIYVDGSHLAADVLSDAVLSWKLLKPGGLMIFDDYLWPIYQDRPLMNPKFAIDAFVNCHLDRIQYVHVPQVSQFCLVKRRDDLKA